MTPKLDEPSSAGEAVPGGDQLRGGRYAVSRLLGSGSQGETLEAVDKAAGRPVAIKRFVIRGAKSWKDVELAEREASVLASLAHPGLPRYIEHFEENGALYLVMERIEGETLASRRRRGAPLDQQQVLRFLREIGECLRYLHGHAPPIVHRDIKPGNVILRPDGSYCLVDFGSVRDRLKPEGGSTVVGTFGFMAPEQFQGRAVPASDVYAVGATALSLLTGSEPEDLPHKGLAIDVEAALGKQADRRLVGALRSMLEPDPDQRAGSVEAVLDRFGFDAQARGTANAASAKQARRARVEVESSRRASKQQRKAERRARRRERQRWHGRGRPLAPQLVLGVLLLVAFRVARLGTFALFQVLLPLLFTLLAVFGGRRMVQHRQRMLDIGRAGRRGLDRASEHIRHQFLASDELAQRADERTPRERLRVADADDGTGDAEAPLEARIEAELEAAAEALEARIEGRERRRHRH